MAITEPLLNDLGAGYARQGTTVTTRMPLTTGGRDRPKGRRFGRGRKIVRVVEHSRRGFPVRQHARIKPRKIAGQKQVAESELDAGSLSSYHTSSVNAPLGYQGLFRGY